MHQEVAAALAELAAGVQTLIMLTQALAAMAALMEAAVDVGVADPVKTEGSVLEAQFALSGPVLHEHSHLLIQETCNGTVYQN
jgi:hypothetical protein